MSSESPSDEVLRPVRSLATPVERLPGVTPARAELLERLELRFARDVLFNFPRDYHDLSNVRAIEDLEEDQLVSVQGTVEDVDARSLRRGGSMVGVLIREGNQFLRGSWFNQAYMRDKFAFGQRVMFSGKPRRRQGRWEMVHPRVQWLADDEDDVAGCVLPIYGLTEGLKQRHLRHLARVVVERFVDEVDEVLPAGLLEQYHLLGIGEALRQIHFPDSLERLSLARRRLVFQELLVLQLALAVRREQLRHDFRAPQMAVTARIDARIRRLFPFELTAGQRAAIDEIAGDMARGYPMNRLLQGDVGSGKTVVAVYAMLLAVAHGYQAVLMAPTEVLARQHLATLDRFLALSQVERALLVGGQSAAERQPMLQALAAGQIDLAVGTQAVLQSGVEFARLGLVVIDEQHKFGVRQRATLRGIRGPAPDGATPGGRREALQQTLGFESPPPSGAPVRTDLDPHYLVMTATPIPRTLTMTLFGDLDVSILRELPPGRRGVKTYWATQEQRAEWWAFFRQKLDQGRQGYVVAPLVDDSDEIQAASVRTVFDELSRGELSHYRLAMLHGRMSTAEKNEVMGDFRRRHVQVLVATSVIEVGLDIPNATLLTIEGGERFGLSQLHQLRGRVSRGHLSGVCCVFADPATDEARRRLEAFVDTTDGFELAEADFSIRGPGDLLGTRQHGLPPLRIADLVRDGAILEEARRAAQAIVAADAGLAQPDYARLRRQVLTRYGRVLELGDVG